MKNTLLILALATGLLSAAGTTRADIIYENNLTSSLNYKALIYVPTSDNLFASSPFNYPAGYLGFESNGNGIVFIDQHTSNFFGETYTSSAYITPSTSYYFFITTLLASGDLVSSANTATPWQQVYPEGSAEPVEQYIGIREIFNGDSYYGWAGFTLDEGGVFTLKEVAFNSVAGESITVGTTAIPEPSTYAAIFGMFALGFCAYSRRRMIRA